MAKTALLDPKARAAKKKKQVIALGVVFVALLAFQVPRTMKMLHPSATAATSGTHGAAATPSETATPVTTATPAASAAPAPAPSGGDVFVVNADVQPAPLEGQLPDLTRFRSKDPFAQQGTPPSTETTATAPPAAAAPKRGEHVAAQPPPVTSTVQANAAVTPAPSSAPTPPAPRQTAATPPPAATPAPPPAPTAAVLSVNGVREQVGLNADFPRAAPTFHLAALTAKTAKVSIAGGSLASGAPTVTLELGKPTTLMNTADGTRYVLVLVSTGGSAQPAASQLPPDTPGATTPGTTTP